jgi:phenylacetate-CoA ligase
MSEPKLDLFIQQIRRLRPRMLFGYPSALSLIAEHAGRRGIAMDDLGIRVAFVTSECLYEHQRQTIEQIFGCRVANGYGGRDAGFIAHECPSGRMHITAEDIIVETVRTDGSPCAPGEPGEIVVTHLATRDFPFIRYRTGDVGALGEATCACGRGLPVLEEIQGRTTDFVLAQDGTVMHGLALIYVLRDLPGVRAFRVVQHSLDHISVRLVVDAAVDRKSHGAAIESGFRRRLGQTVRVEIAYVDQISAEKSGKFRYVVSHVADRAKTPLPASARREQQDKASFHA